MGESSFLALWFNRCAVMMGMFIYVCLCVCYYLAVGPALFSSVLQLLECFSCRFFFNTFVLLESPVM